MRSDRFEPRFDQRFDQGGRFVVHFGWRLV